MICFGIKRRTLDTILQGTKRGWRSSIRLQKSFIKKDIFDHKFVIVLQQNIKGSKPMTLDRSSKGRRNFETSTIYFPSWGPKDAWRNEKHKFSFRLDFWDTTSRPSSSFTQLETTNHKPQTMQQRLIGLGVEPLSLIVLGTKREDQRGIHLLYGIIITS